MAARLTQRCIEAIMRGENIESPVVQFLNHRRIPKETPADDRYRVVISDGIHYNTFAMLSTQLNNLITDGELQENSIVRLDRYTCNDVPLGNGIKKILVISNLTILVKGDVVGAKIGSPVSHEEIDNAQPPAPVPNISMEVAVSNPVPHTAPVASPMRNGYENHDVSLQENKNIIRIAALNPYQNRWCIKARVVQKRSIRTWSKAKSHGTFFSMDLTDESGVIRATAYNEAVDKFYNMLELNKVYFFSKCAIKAANRNFPTPHDFELTLNLDSQVDPCAEENRSIPEVQFNFSPLSALKDIAPNSFVDIVGVCKSATEVRTLVAKSTKQELKKREITLVDTSDTSFNVTLWGSQAENFDATNTPIVAIKKAKITEFNGLKSASLCQNSQMLINPDIPKAHQLRGWYDSLDNNHEFSSISAGIGGKGAREKLWNLKEALSNRAGGQDRDDYFNVEATVLLIKSDQAIYQACPKKECGKKVVDNNNGTFRCEKCNKEYNTCEYRLALNVQICDWTGNHWVSIFQDQAEVLLGTTAAEVSRSRDNYSGVLAYDEIFRKPLFKTYNFRIRARMDTFNNETRLKMSAVNLRPSNCKESCRRLMEEIKTLSGVSIATH